MGGIFGVISKQKCISDLYYGTDYHSHLGTRMGGLVTLNQEGGFARAIHSLGNAQFRSKFEEDLPKFEGNSGIGVISDTDPQPIIMNSHLGKFAVVTVGKINNIAELEKELLDAGKSFTELSSGHTNPTEVVALLISTGKTFSDGIEIVKQKIKGSCSFLVLTLDGIYACRDRYGRTPLVTGKKDGAWAVCTETCSLPNLGFEAEHFLGPGEVRLLSEDKAEQIAPEGEKLQICSFLWIYYGYPTSCYENINVDDVRYYLGYYMGSRDKTQLDVSSAIPDSGTCMAIGYASGKQIPYRCAVVKYTPSWPRSFTPPKQSIRDTVAKMKLIPNKVLLREKRIAFCDDSIVRGTQLRDNARVLYGYGAREIHIRISCPPLIFPCTFVNFSASRTPTELIARRYIAEKESPDFNDFQKYVDDKSEEHKEMVNYIKNELKLTSLKYNTLDTLVKSIGLPKERVCTHCFDGSSFGG